jgi:putative PIN family toxin of toxin-antitoxin system
MKVVLDCNVLISAGLNAGTCRSVLSDVVRAHQLILSQAILQDVTVARRPRFAVAGNTLIGLIKAVSGNAVLVDPDPASVPLPDPKDQIYLDTAIAAGAEVVITGNKMHFPKAANLVVPVHSCRSQPSPVSPALFSSQSWTLMYMYHHKVDCTRVRHRAIGLR